MATAATIPDVTEWLLAGDPSVVWQVERDVLGLDTATWAPVRSSLPRRGWVEALLARQDASGTWGGGLYTPKWTSTTYTLLLLRRLGLESGNPAALAGCRHLLDGAKWVDDGVSYWKTHDDAEICVNAMVLSVCAAFGDDDPRLDGIASLLMRSRLGDGGWNCEVPRGATHSSFHTTISALEALAVWRRVRATPDADDALASGREFMLRHRLFRSHRTGEVIDRSWLRPHFPPRWHYDVLRGLDHVRDVGADRDDRMSDAIESLISCRRRDGRWPAGAQYTGAVFFRLEPGRDGSRMNTLRALRVLRWWHGGAV